MSRGIGRRQLEVLIDLRRELRYARMARPWRDREVVIDPETGEFWIRATEVGGVHVNIRSDERDPHPERASVRRSIRSLHRRGLVEARVMTVTTPQRDPDRYEVLHLIPRTALVARLTPAGMEYLEQRVGPYPY